MPLMKYLVFVGSALIVLLLSLNWFLPDPTTPVYSSAERPVIRISSMQTLPEKVVFDTSFPRPPPSVTPVVRLGLPSAFAFEQISPGLLPTFSVLAEVPQVNSKKTIILKREPAKKVVANRAAPQVPVAAAKNHPVPEAERDTRAPVKTTFLDQIADRFGSMFKVN